MANLKETAVWEPVRQLETSDPVMGGENGVSNTAPKQLANRDLWLKTELANAVENLATKATKATTLAGYGITDATQAPTVSTEVDINKYTGNGTFITPFTGLINLPKNWPQNRYFVDVSKVKDSSYIRQRINSSTDALSAYRVFNGSVWSAWIMNYRVNPLSANNIAFNSAIGNAAYPFRNGELTAGVMSDGVIFAGDLGDGDTVQLVITTDGKTYMRSAKSGTWTAKQLDDASWAGIRNKPTTVSGYGITDAATKTDLAAKADKATTLAGYGITDAATKTETNAKADKATTLAGYGITDAVSTPLVSTQTDLNTYQSNGTFMTPTAGLTNLPTDWPQGHYFVDVTKNTGSSYIRQNITNTTTNQAASRVWTGSSWTEWAINTTNSMFAGSLDENGYCILPNGLILQWGKAAVVASGTYVTLPIKFPTKVVAVTAGISSANNPTEALYAYAKSTSQIVVDMSGNNTATATWTALGY